MTRPPLSTEFRGSKVLPTEWAILGLAPGPLRFVTEVLALPSADLVLAFGIIASDVAVRRQQIAKPCIAPFVVDGRMQSLLWDDGKPRTMVNLTYILWSIDLQRDLRAFSERKKDLTASATPRQARTRAEACPPPCISKTPLLLSAAPA